MFITIPKFRVWDADNRVMWYEDDICTFRDIWNMGTNKKDFPNNILCQYVGIFNEVEVWEYDVVEVDRFSKRNKGVVVYHYGSFGFIPDWPDSPDELTAWVHLAMWPVKKVLGNIFQNPDLSRIPIGFGGILHKDML